ncbi:PadR family transcriptional regulator [Sphingosinicella terrae]|uniref:PadR family transcriptional regulator n=1 Tax=Sphingosinicella terrae TaxID=2172047 RepID=UPI000E0DC993|nr:PadR family transcriptional regulator [Sphingosinicella terrae]
MNDPAVTTLGYALLGLIGQSPRSGYRLRLVFETTPLGTYSSSPGSIYPALKRLERAGLVRREAAGGGKPLFHLTGTGAAALQSWLERPVDAEEAIDREIALLRFAFLEGHRDRTLSLSFLAGFAAAAKGQVDALASFLAGEEGRALSLQSRLAVEHGLASARASLGWAEQAQDRLSAEIQKEKVR